MSVARPDRAFFFIAVACALAYVSLPRDTAYYDRWYQLFPVAAVGATLAGVWLNRPRSTAPWYLVAVSGLCAVTADALYAIEREQVGDVPFPSTADYFALASYAVLAVGPPAHDPPAGTGSRLAEPHRCRNRHGRRRDGRLDVPRSAEPDERHERSRDDSRARVPCDGRAPRVARRADGARSGPPVAGIRDGHDRAPVPARGRRALQLRVAARLVPGRRLDRPVLRRRGRSLGDGRAASLHGRAHRAEPGSGAAPLREAARRAFGGHADGAGDARGRRCSGRVERAPRHRGRGSGPVRSRDRAARRARCAARALRASRACPGQRRGRARHGLDARGHPSRHGRRRVRDRRRRRGSRRSHARRCDRRRSRPGKLGRRRADRDPGLRHR